MTEMSEYLLKLSAWHHGEKTAAERRLQDATTKECRDANQRSIERHWRASTVLCQLANALKVIEGATDFVQGE
jgi:hypothetical protein